VHARERSIFMHFHDNSPFFLSSSLGLISLTFVALDYIYSSHDFQVRSRKIPLKNFSDRICLTKIHAIIARLRIIGRDNKMKKRSAHHFALRIESIQINRSNDSKWTVAEDKATCDRCLYVKREFVSGPES